MGPSQLFTLLKLSDPGEYPFREEELKRDLEEEVLKGNLDFAQGKYRLRQRFNVSSKLEDAEYPIFESAVDKMLERSNDAEVQLGTWINPGDAPTDSWGENLQQYPNHDEFVENAPSSSDLSEIAISHPGPLYYPDQYQGASTNTTEDGTKILDLHERPRIQDRIAQHNYRRNTRTHLKALERREGSPSASLGHKYEKSAVLANDHINSPQLEQTVPDIYQDEFYDPTFVQPAASDYYHEARPALGNKYDERTRDSVQLGQRTEQEQQEQMQAQQRKQQRQRQQQQEQQHPLDHLLQRQAPIDTLMPWLGTGAFGSVSDQFTIPQLPAGATRPTPSLPPPSETLGPSSLGISNQRPSPFPQTPIFQETLHAANAGHLAVHSPSPIASISPQRPPFLEASPFRPRSTSPLAHRDLAPPVREQQKLELSDASIYAKQNLPRADLMMSSKRISPRAALLQHNDFNEDANVSLFEDNTKKKDVHGQAEYYELPHPSFTGKRHPLYGNSVFSESQSIFRTNDNSDHFTDLLFEQDIAKGSIPAQGASRSGAKTDRTPILL